MLPKHLSKLELISKQPMMLDKPHCTSFSPTSTCRHDNRHYAASKNRLELAQFLLDGKVGASVADKRGQTPLYPLALLVMTNKKNDVDIVQQCKDTLPWFDFY